MSQVRCVWPLGAQLGEGPIWLAGDSVLWFVDIKGRLIHRFDPATAGSESWPAPDQVSFVLPRTDGTFVVGLPGKLACFEPGAGSFSTLVTLEADRPRNRLNDACVDSHGRVWFGSMDDDETEPQGVLYSWDGTAPPISRDAGFVISNGPAFSPDGSALYHTDTVNRTIYRFDVTPDGAISGKRKLIEIEPDAGWPDGTAIDAEGCLWIALYGGWAVRRYSPAGELLRKIAIPCARPTKLAFGDPDLRTAFVTTARAGLSSDELAQQPLAGGLFAFDPEISGIPHSPCVR
jgi:xylono-1,5-lactonase